MKASMNVCVAAALCIAAIAPCQAGVIGWLDSVYVSSNDTAYGWVCENEDPYNTPSYGSLDVYLNGGPDSGGYFYENYPLDSGTWQQYKAGVNQAGYCGSDSYVGFNLPGWFDQPGHPGTNTLYVYWKSASGSHTLIGQGIPMTKVGPNP